MARRGQLSLALRPSSGWGGRRPRAGRKARPRRPVPHRSRERFPARHPTHVTVRVRADVPSLRTVRLVRALERSFTRGCERPGFRLVHYSLQSNHAHFVVEAAGRKRLANGMKSLAARLARAVNRTFRRRGPVLAERYHLHVLRTPREAHNAIRYVLLNARKHARRLGRRMGLDPASSGRWFDGWRGRPPPAEGSRPIARARTWLLSVGWRRHGLLDPSDVPGPSG